MSSQHFSEPPSILARRKDGEGPKKQSREEYRRQKELEELRKAGNAPAETDESGKDINPHIPKYMVDVPWYVTYDRAKPTLKHQRFHDEKKVEFDGLDKWYTRGVQGTQLQAIKFREGACDNCGAFGHKRVECLEKPRKKLARYGAGVIAMDDHHQPELNLTFDGKRDRWNGVDMDSHQEKVRDEFLQLEEARRLMKEKKLEQNMDDPKLAAAALAAASVPREHDSDEEDQDEDKYADEMELPQKLHLESKQRISVRNLRMREDTAKYLLNLDPNSAYYDPKSRSMRDNPFAEKGDGASSVTYIGDNFVRHSGEARTFAKSQKFAWEVYDKGVDIHQQADPTKVELFRKEYLQKSEQVAKDNKASVLEKYGGEEHLKEQPRELRFGQTSDYVEYNRFGQVVKLPTQAVTKSKYIEDQFFGNHTKVWGSYWTNMKWGYMCCQSTERNSFCRDFVEPEVATFNENGEKKIFL